MKHPAQKSTIGSVEWCALPSLNLPAIKARIDSGAKTSSIHAFNIRPFQRDGRLWVAFEVHPVQKNRRIVVPCEHPVVDQRAVKNTGGEAETRYVIATTMKLGRRRWDIELTLANRDSMGYRMLLGREAMQDRLIVDPSERYLLGKLAASRVDSLYLKADRASAGRPLFRAGGNIAIKVPPHEFERTVGFYRDILGFDPTEESDERGGNAAFDFGDKTLWIDRVAGISQAEIWLQVFTDNIAAAEDHLAQHDCVRRDEIESLPDGLRAFWVASPANIIHLISEE